MLATYPQHRGQGIGTALMGLIDRLASEAGCELASIEVFEINQTALKLYRQLGYEIVDQRPMIASDYLPACQVLLLTRQLAST